MKIWFKCKLEVCLLSLDRKSKLSRSIKTRVFAPEFGRLSFT